MSERRAYGRSKPEPWPGPAMMPRRASGPQQPRHDARILTGDGGTALIELDDQVYTLRITRQRKLILTK